MKEKVLKHSILVIKMIDDFANYYSLICTLATFTMSNQEGI